MYEKVSLLDLFGLFDQVYLDALLLPPPTVDLLFLAFKNVANDSLFEILEFLGDPDKDPLNDSEFLVLPALLVFLNFSDGFKYASTSFVWVHHGST